MNGAINKSTNQPTNQPSKQASKQSTISNRQTRNTQTAANPPSNAGRPDKPSREHAPQHRPRVARGLVHTGLGQNRGEASRVKTRLTSDRVDWSSASLFGLPNSFFGAFDSLLGIWGGCFHFGLSCFELVPLFVGLGSQKENPPIWGIPEKRHAHLRMHLLAGNANMSSSARFPSTPPAENYRYFLRKWTTDGSRQFLSCPGKYRGANPYAALQKRTWFWIKESLSVMLWMDEILHHFETMRIMVCCYLQGGNWTIPLGFLGHSKVVDAHPASHFRKAFGHQKSGRPKKTWI